MIVDLVRHADTGRRGHLDGREDPPLRDGATDGPCRRHAGIAWTRVTSSPLRRAHDTALALALPTGLPVELDNGWVEFDFGDWDGRAGADLPAAALAAFHHDPRANPPPNGEAWDVFEARIGRGLQALLASADPGPQLVVSHGGTLRMALALACGLPLVSTWALRIDYGTRLRLRLEAGDDGRPWGEVLELAQP
ncbi:histidine phosphatase family protein [Luteimonas sp. MJ204]|uniref:histidine phosphatase family protein n=1 Tax=Luteimonas sp. MJ145 TaxID=3129234 RepID=UPI0031BA34BF